MGVVFFVISAIVLVAISMVPLRTFLFGRSKGAEDE